METNLSKSSYAKAGVDIDAGASAKKLILKQALKTLRPEVLSGVGPFGGMFELKGFRDPVLVSSTDSVGTKLKIAINLDRLDTVGIDIVNHCVNDIFTTGAEPLFFLDYIGISKVVPEKVAEIVSGIACACKEAGCALIGGETAELSDLYAPGDFDLVGFIIGAIEKDEIITGKNIVAGDIALGLPSSGPHTNGYSLIRRILGDSRSDMEKSYPELGRTIGEALMEPHRCYYNELKHHLSLVKGLAHITGGGLVDNVPRVLPEGLGARFRQSAWEVPPLFRLIQERGSVDPDEMYRVFNMGIGMVVICAPENADALLKSVPGSLAIGEVEKAAGKARVVIKK